MKIAITGSMGSGKSLASKTIRDLGYQVYDTDKMVHAYYAPSGVAYDELITLFGEGIVMSDGTLDRPLIAQRVFQDEEMLRQLEGIVYPHLADEIKSIEAKNELVFFEVPVLFESGFDTYFDRVLMIDVDPQIRIERLITRGMSEEDIQNRLAHQMDPQLKRDKSHAVIDNNDSKEVFEDSIKAYVTTLEKEFKHGSI